MPAEMQDQARSGLKLHQEQKTRMVKAVLETYAEVWSEKELKDMDVEALSKITKTIPTVVDYSLNSSTEVRVNSGQVLNMYPGGIGVEETKKEGKEEK